MKTFGVENTAYLNKVNKGRRENRKICGEFSCETERGPEIGAKRLTFGQCDRIKICAAAGYTLKAKVEDNLVYVEQKSEDGTVRGFEINPLGIRRDTTDPLERIALEAWEKKGEEKKMVAGITSGVLYHMYKARTAMGGELSGPVQAPVQNDSDILGSAELTFSDAPDVYRATAKYGEGSTAEDPIVEVTAECGGKRVLYQVHINDVNPRNATAVEMFALCSFADAAGWGIGGKTGSFQMLQTYTEGRMKLPPDNTTLFDNAGGFAGEKTDWVKAVNQTMREHKQRIGGEAQFQEGVKLLGFFYKAGADENLKEGEEAIFSEEKIDGYLEVLRKFRDRQFDRGEMVGCRETAIVCNDLINISDDMTGKSEYAASLVGASQIYRMEGRVKSGIIGFEAFGTGNSTYLMHAAYAENSTAENPIITVSVYHAATDSYEREQTIEVNKIDPRNATQLEMFALCSHAEAQGLTGISGMYRNLLRYTENDQTDGYRAESLDDFVSKKRNWIEAVRNGITEQMAAKDRQAAHWKELLLDFLSRLVESKFEEMREEENRSGTNRIRGGKEGEEKEDDVPEEALQKLFEDRQ